jgi:hypothetical protein
VEHTLVVSPLPHSIRQLPLHILALHSITLVQHIELVEQHKPAQQAVDIQLVERIELGAPLRKQVLGRLVEQHIVPHIQALEHKQALERTQVVELGLLFELVRLFELEQLFEQGQLFELELAQGHSKLSKLVVIKQVFMEMVMHTLLSVQVKRIEEQLELV